MCLDQPNHGIRTVSLEERGGEVTRVDGGDDDRRG
jgi:hypothetical protein